MGEIVGPRGDGGGPRELQTITTTIPTADAHRSALLNWVARLDEHAPLIAADVCRRAVSEIDAPSACATATEATILVRLVIGGARWEETADPRMLSVLIGREVQQYPADVARQAIDDLLMRPRRYPLALPDLRDALTEEVSKRAVMRSMAAKHLAERDRRERAEAEAVKLAAERADPERQDRIAALLADAKRSLEASACCASQRAPGTARPSRSYAEIDAEAKRVVAESGGQAERAA